MQAQQFLNEETGYQRYRGRSPRRFPTDSTTRPPAWRRGSSRSSGRGATVMRRRAPLHEGRAPDGRDALLGAGDRQLVVPPLLRGPARRQVPADGLRVESDRLRDLPKELIKPPRVWADRAFNVQRWTRMPSGGHFAAMEEPRALVDRSAPSSAAALARAERLVAPAVDFHDVADRAAVVGP